MCNRVSNSSRYKRERNISYITKRASDSTKRREKLDSMRVAGPQGMLHYFELLTAARTADDIAATYRFVCRKKISDTLMRILMRSRVESPLHALFLCHHAQAVWMAAGWWHLCIWSERNRLVHDSIFRSPDIAVAFAKSFLNKCKENQDRVFFSPATLQAPVR
ncbi:hypothetical protein ACOSQ2_030850 [Xanthoceras sorbifolium]